MKISTDIPSGPGTFLILAIEIACITLCLRISGHCVTSSLFGRFGLLSEKRFFIYRSTIVFNSTSSTTGSFVSRIVVMFEEFISKFLHFFVSMSHPVFFALFISFLMFLLIRLYSALLSFANFMFHHQYFVCHPSPFLTLYVGRIFLLHIFTTMFRNSIHRCSTSL